MSNKDQFLYKKCFEALKKWKERKSELIRLNLPIYYLEEEFFRASFVLKKWKEYHAQAMKRRRAFEAVAASQRRQTITTCMSCWREQLHNRQNYNLKAIPFHVQLVLGNVKRQAFNALMANREVGLEEKENFRKAFEFYRYRLLQKSIEMLKWHGERQEEQKVKIEFM